MRPSSTRWSKWLVVVAAVAALSCGPAGVVAPPSTPPGETPGPASPLKWAWQGAVTPTSFVVKAKATTPARLTVREATPILPDPPVLRWPPEGFNTPDARSILTWNVEGLQPGTVYTWEVENEAGEKLEGRVKTFKDGQYDFKLGFAACAYTGSNSTVFDSIRAKDLDVFVHMGDFHYEDITRNDPALFRAAFDRVLASPRQSQLYRHVPIAYMWDDHDFGSNNSLGSSAGRPAAQQVYREYVPHYPLPLDRTGAIAHAFTIGRVRVIVTDLRSQKTPRISDSRRRSMLGPAQLTWFERELEDAAGKYPLVVWVNTVPWITESWFTTGDTWKGYRYERERIANLIYRLGLNSRLVMLSGDAHMVAMDDGTNSNYAPDAPSRTRGFVVAHAAPLDKSTSFKGGPYSQGHSEESGQFGMLEVKDDGKTLEAEVTGRNIQGDVIPHMRILLHCAEGTCKIEVPSKPSR
ncbi:MAG: alkaline phosphatase family protein [Vicinamibacteraceae bacterium]|nr:alkaline phosphatase family protein [Vicinamibacteraceae bacterium]